MIVIVTGTSVEGVKEFKQQMMKELEMTDLGLLTTTSILKYTKEKISSC